MTDSTQDLIKGDLSEPIKPTTMTQTSDQPLSSLTAVCFGIIRGWVKVVCCGKGGQIDAYGTPWTRLPAREITSQLAREFRVEVSMRTVYRALKELEDAKLIRREQRLSHRWKQDYWYTLTGNENIPRTTPVIQQPPRRTASTANCQVMTPKGKNQVSTEVPSMANAVDRSVFIHSPSTANQYLSAQFNKSLFLEPEQATEPKPRAKSEKNQRSREKMRKGTEIARELKPVGDISGLVRRQAKELALGQPQKKRDDIAKGFKPTISKTQKPRPVHRAEQLVGIDKQGRAIKEVWVSGFRHLVID